MFFKIFLTFTALLISVGKCDPDPISFFASTPSTLRASPSPKFAGKEVIAYLTEKQIEDIKSGRGTLEPVIEPPKQSEENIESVVREGKNYYDDQLKIILDQRKKYIQSQSKVIRIGNRKPKTYLPEKNSNEELQETGQTPWYPRENNRYELPSANLERNKYIAVTTERPEQSANRQYYVSSTQRPDDSDYYISSSEKPGNLHQKSINYYRVYNEKKGDNILLRIFHPSHKGLLESEESKVLDTNQENLSNKKNIPSSYEYGSEEELRSQEYEDEKPNDEEGGDAKYVIRYRNQLKPEEIQELLKNENTQSDIGARSPSERRKKLNKDSKLQLRTRQPYIIQISEPVKIKAQKTYSLPEDLFRQIPAAIEEISAEKPLSGSQQVYVKVDKPSFIERSPSDDERRGYEQSAPRILARVWKHY